jgi:hypothetical protein
VARIEFWIWYNCGVVRSSFEEPEYRSIKIGGKTCGYWYCKSWIPLSVRDTVRLLGISDRKVRKITCPQGYWIKVTPQWVYE